MVFFNCSNCGDALKKNQVEKHCNTKCRSAKFMSCVDCGVDFWGEDYVKHTKCISEEQKYNGKDFVSKRNVNKADIKADNFKQQIEKALEKCGNNTHQSFMNKLLEADNVPNKKRKFENYAKNCFRSITMNVIDDVWTLIDAEKPKVEEKVEVAPVEKSPSPEPVAREPVEDVKKLNKRERKEARRVAQSGKADNKKKRSNKNDDEAVSQKENIKKKSRKRKQESDDEDENDEEPKSKTMKSSTELKTKSHKFNWDNVIVNILKKADGNEIKLKKLQRKVLAVYADNENNKIPKTEEELYAKFTHKVNHNKRFKCSKNIVKLVK